jgi:ribose transport system ATP-binding protein
MHESVEMQGIVKNFPGVLALDHVDLSCLSGEVHAIVGENGAGKSTLMKILAGAYRADAGKILIHGKEVTLHSPSDAQREGISIIYQEFNLIPELNVAENIFLGREPKNKFGLIDSAKQYEMSRRILNSLGVRIDLHTLIKDLGVAQQQMVEIAKSLSINAEIIVMDEPSAVVSGKELDSLFRTINTLKADNKTIVYISHRIDEVFQIADRATVLRDGKLIGSVKTKEVEKSTIISMMVGRSLTEKFPAKEKQQSRKEVLSVKGLCKGSVLRNVSFRLFEGEILGIAGLVGAGRTELVRSIFGVESIDKGEVILRGKGYRKRSPKNSIRNGIGFVTENRSEDGLVHLLSIRANVTLPILNRIRNWFVIAPKKERQVAEEAVRKFSIASRGIDQEVRYLSGGNQQKVILAKWIGISPALLILDEPTRGIDVGAKSEVYVWMSQLARQRTSILMISSEIPEILGMSDRILVMHEGEIAGELSREEATEEGVLMLATGQAGKNRP